MPMTTMPSTEIASASVRRLPADQKPSTKLRQHQDGNERRPDDETVEEDRRGQPRSSDELRATPGIVGDRTGQHDALHQEAAPGTGSRGWSSRW